MVGQLLLADRDQDKQVQLGAALLQVADKAVAKLILADPKLKARELVQQALPDLGQHQDQVRVVAVLTPQMEGLQLVVDLDRGLQALRLVAVLQAVEPVLVLVALKVMVVPQTQEVLEQVRLQLPVLLQLKDQVREAVLLMVDKLQQADREVGKHSLQALELLLGPAQDQEASQLLQGLQCQDHQLQQALDRELQLQVELALHKGQDKEAGVPLEGVEGLGVQEQPDLVLAKHLLQATVRLQVLDKEVVHLVRTVDLLRQLVQGQGLLRVVEMVLLQEVARAVDLLTLDI